MSSAGSRVRRPERRRWLRWVLLTVVVVLGALALLALPFRTVPGNAQTARVSLEAAKIAIVDGDAEAAEQHVTEARAAVDSLTGALNGPGGTVWGHVPLASGPIHDAQNLGAALDDLTSVAEIGMDTWPRVAAEDRSLVRDNEVDLDELSDLSGDTREVLSLVRSARSHLAAVADSRPGLGTMLSDPRDEAVAKVQPLADALETAVPVLDELPTILGASGPRTYLVAMLNQSEQRYSGGAPLTFARLSARGGRITTGEAVDSLSEGLYEQVRWPKVTGNPFHRGKLRISGANFAPSWSVSGPEMANAWQRVMGDEVDGVIAIDITAVADLLAVTGPIDAPGYGVLDKDTLVRETIGNYDAYDEGEGVFDLNDERHDLNRALVPALSTLLFDSSDIGTRGSSLLASARGRHFAMWVRSDVAQSALAGAGLSGDLSDTDQDYIGVFNQNTNASKADYWLKESVRSSVRVHEDGSADVRLKVSLHNDSPPWHRTTPDPQGSSFVTRWNGTSVAAFLPKGVTRVRATVDGEPLPDAHVGDFFGRPFTRTTLELAPQARRTYVLRYSLPAAASVGDDGSLTYGLDYDPPALVNPQQVRVTVRFPDGMRVIAPPEEWTAEENVATWADGADRSEAFTVSATP